MKEEQDTDEKKSLERQIESRIAEFDSELKSDKESSPDNAREIREQTGETRLQRSETTEAVEDNSSLADITERIKDQVSEQIGGAVENVKDAIHEKTIAVSESVSRNLAQIGNSNLVKKTRNNSWLISVVGMGIGAILVGALFGGNNKRRRKSHYRNDFADRHEFEKDYTEQTRRNFDSHTADHSDYESDLGEDYATNFADEDDTEDGGESSSKVSRIADSARQSIGGAASKTYENIGKASRLTYEKAGDLSGEAMKNYSHYIRENPLAVGAVIFAVGAAIGYAIPLTEVENNFLGEMRDNVLDKAQTSAQETIDTVKQMADDARQTIVDEVQKQKAA